MQIRRETAMGVVEQEGDVGRGHGTVSPTDRTEVEINMIETAWPGFCLNGWMRGSRTAANTSSPE